MVRGVPGRVDRAVNGTALKVGGIAGGIVGYLFFVEFTSGILQGFYTPLLTDIARHLNIHDADVNWFEAAQLLLSAMVVPVFAKLGDIHGYRRMLLVTTALTAAASWAVAFSPTFWVFLVAWSLQGFYVVWLPLQVALVYARSRGRADGPSLTRRATGVIVAALQAGAIVGALAGGQAGALAQDRLWLALSIPAAAVTAVFFVVWFRIPESPEKGEGTLDRGGVVLLSLTLLLVSAGLTFMRTNGLGTWWAWALVVVGVASLWPLGRYELRQADPLVDLRVLRRPTMWPIMVTAALFGVSILGAQGPLSTFARTDPEVYGYGLGASSMTVSLLVGGYVVSCLLGALAFSRITRLLTPRRTLILAASLVAVGYLLFLPFHETTANLLTNMVVAGLGSGALVAALPAAAAAAAPVGRTAVATGLTNTTKTIGGTFASCVFALALISGTHATLDGSEATAGSLSGYMIVWTICGVTAVVAAVVLAFVPRLAFADAEAQPVDPVEPLTPQQAPVVVQEAQQ